MNKDNFSKKPTAKIRPIRKTDIDKLVILHNEFEIYLKNLDQNRKAESIDAFRNRLIKDGFGRTRAFKGFIAMFNNIPVGYILYHEGYDPDEMQGRIIHVIDLYVKEKERRNDIGSLLMNNVVSKCRQMNGIGIYFYVWNKNKIAIEFYKSLGVVHNKELILFKWAKKNVTTCK